MNHLLPAPRDDHHLGQLLRRSFRSQHHVAQFQTIPPELFHRLAELLAGAEGQEIWPPVQRAFARRLPAGRRAGAGSGTRSGHPGAQPAGPGHRLALLPTRALGRRASGGLERRAATPVPALTAWHRDAAACRAEIRIIRRRLEEEGVNVDIVFGLEVLDRALTRLALMAAVIDAASRVPALGRHPEAAGPPDRAGPRGPEPAQAVRLESPAAAPEDRRTGQPHRRALHRLDPQGVPGDLVGGGGWRAADRRAPPPSSWGFTRPTCRPFPRGFSSDSTTRSASSCWAPSVWCSPPSSRR